MKTFFKVVALFMSILMLQGCSTKAETGTLIGGTAGALLGSRFGKGSGNLAATGLGAVVGAAIGNSIGSSLDDYDKQSIAQSSQQALEYSSSGSSIEWKNPDNGNHGSITPTRTFKNDQGGYCREYTQTIVIGGQEKKAYGRACRMPDGHWQIIE